MSSVADVVCCAKCGVAEVDEIKLEDCDGCDLVKYCSDKCREGHREQHIGECRKRAQQLHDNDLFTQPDISYLGECPLCFLTMPLDPQKSAFHSCCSKSICDGCNYADIKSNGGKSCPFCREPTATDEEDIEKKIMIRVK